MKNNRLKNLSGYLSDIEHSVVKEIKNSALNRAILDLIFIIDEDGRYLETNDCEYLKLFYPPSLKIIGETFDNIFPADVAQSFHAFLQKALQSNECISMEYPLAGLDGNSYFFESRCVALEELINGKRATIWVIRDITARKVAEQLAIDRGIELAIANEEKFEQAAELAIADIEKTFQNKERARLVIANEEKSKQVLELNIAYEERDKRASELEESIRETNQTEDQMLASLNALSLVRDNETGNHVIRTQHYVKAIATRLFAMGKYPDQINEQKIDLLFRAAPLHDIGKIGIPDSILQNPSKLDDDEWATMKTHTTIGESVLSAANLQYQNKKTIIGTAIKIAGGHHEHWDGSGYPRGLVGEVIPVAARIMAIADVYDALVSKRIYKQQWTHEQAAQEIISMRGTKFDPVIVDAFIAEQNNILEIAQQYRDA